MDFNAIKSRAKVQLKARRTMIKGCIYRNSLLNPEHMYDQEKYSTVIAFPMDDQETLSIIENAMRATFEQNRKKLRKNGKEPVYEEVVKPLREDDDIPNFYFLRAATTEQPNIVDAQKKPLHLTSEPVSGARANVTVFFKAIKAEGTSRIYAVLQNVQLVKNKNYLEDINTFTADEDFDEIPDDEIA